MKQGGMFSPVMFHFTVKRCVTQYLAIAIPIAWCLCCHCYYHKYLQNFANLHSCQKSKFAAIDAVTVFFSECNKEIVNYQICVVYNFPNCSYCENIFIFNSLRSVC